MSRWLINCAFSDIVGQAFRNMGHEAYECDLRPSIVPNNPWHIQADGIDVAYNADRWGKWDGMVAHPPCRYLSNSGVMHLYIGGRKANGRDEDRWTKMYEAARFFKLMLDAPIDKICVENPRMHCYAEAAVGSKATQYIQPWQHGHGETKETGFHLKNLPSIQPTDIVEGREPRIHMMSPGMREGLTRTERRSITLPGIAMALAFFFTE